jgi:hypothetical protein
LCQAGNCQDQLAALKDDAKGNALVACGQAKMCGDQCCICGTSSAGAMCASDYANYGMGPCAAEVQMAAGVEPGTGLSGALAGGMTVTMACDPAGTGSNSCNHATKLAKCTTDKCASSCPNVKSTCP